MNILSPRELKATSKARLDLQMRGLCVRVKESRHFQPHLQFSSPGCPNWLFLALLWG